MMFSLAAILGLARAFLISANPVATVTALPKPTGGRTLSPEAIVFLEEFKAWNATQHANDLTAGNLIGRAPRAIRHIELDINIVIRDDELFGDDWFSFDKPIKTVPIGGESGDTVHVPLLSRSAGGEIRVEIVNKFTLVTGNTIEMTTLLTFYEGTSQDTGELSGWKFFSRTIPAGGHENFDYIVWNELEDSQTDSGLLNALVRSPTNHSPTLSGGRACESTVTLRAKPSPVRRMPRSPGKIDNWLVRVKGRIETRLFCPFLQMCRMLENKVVRNCHALLPILLICQRPGTAFCMILIPREGEVNGSDRFRPNSREQGGKAGHTTRNGIFGSLKSAGKPMVQLAGCQSFHQSTQHGAVASLALRDAFRPKNERLHGVLDLDANDLEQSLASFLHSLCVGVIISASVTRRC